MTRLLLLPLAVVAAASVLVAPAAASQLVDRNARNVRLAVNARGEALLTYRTGGRLRRVLAWGAVNARPPSTTQAQVAFRLDYAGGWGKYRRDEWRTFRDVCRRYDGPPLAWLVTACKAPDGSLLGLQRGSEMLPNYGLDPTPDQSVWELHLSHWTGDAAVLELRHGLGLAPLRPPLRHASPTGTSRLRVQLDAPAGSRSTRSAATSTSTRSTRRTAQAGSARTAS